MARYLRFRLAVVLIALAAPSIAVSHAAQSSLTLPAAKIEKIEAAISTEMARQNIPAMTVAVAIDNQLRWANGYGLADLENSVPAKATTVYRLGSISKPITAVAVMQLVEKGKIDLDAPVQKYVPSFPEKQWPITTRQLLGHLTGIRHYAPGEIESTRHYPSLLGALDIFKEGPLLHEPGARMTYTTYGYTLLGAIVESASGMKFAEYVQENIFKPAGMDRIRVDNVFEIIPNRAQGYQKSSNGELRNSGLADTSYKIPGGGFCSTAADLIKFAIAVQTGVLLKKETVEQMFTSLKTKDGKATNYGLGWQVSQENGRRVIGHGGAQQRVTTRLIFMPEERVSVAIMCNLEGVNLGPLGLKIAAILLE